MIVSTLNPAYTWARAVAKRFAGTLWSRNSPWTSCSAPDRAVRSLITCQFFRTFLWVFNLSLLTKPPAKIIPFKDTAPLSWKPLEVLELLKAFKLWHFCTCRIISCISQKTVTDNLLWGLIRECKDFLLWIYVLALHPGSKGVPVHCHSSFCPALLLESMNHRIV